MSALRRLAEVVMPARIMDWLLELRHGSLPVPYRVVRPHSLVSNLNLLFLAELLRRVDASRTPGDVVECGVYRGGSAGVLAYHAVRSPFPRKVWLYDAFSGMPPTTDKDDDYSRSIVGQFVGSEKQTRRILSRLHIPTDRFQIVRGWFNETLPQAPVGQIALLHVDCDFYDPVLLTLKTFYPAVAPGGFLVFNDYGSFLGCRQAVDEFFEAESSNLIQIDSDAYYMVKAGSLASHAPRLGTK
jgi:O-methyltransferase